MTFALFAYNQERFIREAVEGALAQDYSPLEIILSDDCSVDSTFSIMNDLAMAYKGPHTVILNRNSANQGLGRHINSVMTIANGEFIVVAAGDDVSMCCRSRLLCDKWLKTEKKADLLCSNYIAMSENGASQHTGCGCKPEQMNPVAMARYGYGVTGATAAWTSRLWDRFGDLPNDAIHEDQLLPFRAILMGGIDVVNEPLVRYRMGTSTWIERGKANAKEMRRRTVILAKNALSVARTQAVDAERLDRPDLKKMIQKREKEYSLILAIHEGKNIALIDIIFELLTGIEYKSVIRAYVQYNFPSLHGFILWCRNGTV